MVVVGGGGGSGLQVAFTPARPQVGAEPAGGCGGSPIDHSFVTKIFEYPNPTRRSALSRREDVVAGRLARIMFALDTAKASKQTQTHLQIMVEISALHIAKAALGKISTSAFCCIWQLHINISLPVPACRRLWSTCIPKVHSTFLNEILKLNSKISPFRSLYRPGAGSGVPALPGHHPQRWAHGSRSQRSRSQRGAAGRSAGQRFPSNANALFRA